MTLIFNPVQATAMTYSHAKVQGQLSVSSEDRVQKQTDKQTAGQTDKCVSIIALPAALIIILYTL